MNIGKTHNLFLSNRLSLFAVLFAFIAERLYLTGNQWDNISLWSCSLIQIGIAFFLLQLNHTFNIIHGRTFLPTLFYLLFVGSNPVFYNDLKGSLAALAVVLCYYILFSSYQKPASQVNALNISLLLVLGSLLWTPLLIFFPVLWWGFHSFQCFTPRVFFASLSGFIIVYLFIFTFSVFQGDTNIFFSLLPHFDTLFTVQKPDFTIFEWITWGVLLTIWITIGLYLFILDISEKIWTISLLSFFYLSSFIIFIFFILQSQYKSTWGLINFIPVAFLTGHFFSRSNKKMMQYLLLLFFLFFIVIGIAQHVAAMW